MKDVLISIKPIYVNQIIDGTKKYEFRRKIFRQKVNRVFVYSSSPKKRIVGYFKLTKVISSSPKDLYNILTNSNNSNLTGFLSSSSDANLTNSIHINPQSFYKYYNGAKEAHAIYIDKFIKFEKPINPKEISKKFVVPQSFRYLKENELNQIEKRIKLYELFKKGF